MDEKAIEQAATHLAEARLTGRRLEALPASCRPRDEAEAYAIQDRLHHLLQAAKGCRLIGRKIGCTTDVMQRYLGIDSPCAGGLYDDGVFPTPARLAHGGFRRVGVECEIAVRLGADLPPAHDLHRREGVGLAVVSCLAAVEIVDDRYVDYRACDTPTLIADDFFSAGAVLGAEIRDWQSLDLAGLQGRMKVNGETVGEGVGAAILGHPFEALAWLADALNARGQSLRSGDLVLLGSLVQTQWVEAGATVEIAIDGLGEARVTFD